jgi:potassium intermediate/small conductance calcium-activated channel subfamily N protein 2
MTTVGYGDFFPSSDFGRFLGIVSCFMGIFIISLVLVSIGNVVVLNTEEKNIYTMINTIVSNDDKENRSKQVTGQYLQLALGLKKNKLNMNNGDVKAARDKLLLNLFQFKEKKMLDNLENPLTEEDIIFKKCENLEKLVKLVESQTAEMQRMAINISNKLQRQISS